MIDTAVWIPTFLEALNETFPHRVWFAGLQGSYRRGDATESSDLDLVVILDTLSARDVHTYSALLDSLPHRELLCGFLSGKDELLHWEPSDLFHLYFDTQPLQGSLSELLHRIDRAAISKYIKVSVCNLYHGCVHNMLYGRSEKTLAGLYKSANYVVQAICYLETGSFVTDRQALRSAVAPDEQFIPDTYAAYKHKKPVDFVNMSEALFAWTQKWIARTQ